MSTARVPPASSSTRAAPGGCRVADTPARTTRHGGQPRALGRARCSASGARRASAWTRRRPARPAPREGVGGPTVRCSPLPVPVLGVDAVGGGQLVQGVVLAQVVAHVLHPSRSRSAMVIAPPPGAGPGAPPGRVVTGAAVWSPDARVAGSRARRCRAPRRGRRPACWPARSTGPSVRADAPARPASSSARPACTSSWSTSSDGDLRRLLGARVARQPAPAGRRPRRRLRAARRSRRG